ncbi:UNVERIFIED_CONTAM: hypothetical protein Slati_3508500 [Sesamum latifolium]|uniref:Reverse transcriptase domain-containing protein n=1 Tax=Sesamum latifolium TaxID=2727402 RepID=A0AAW2UHU2_9LAMI
MEEFQDCISQTGLITLPMQGDLYTWHNRSTGDRSLWKRLDRCWLNGWLDRWPETCYDSLHPRTSDHAPLVLREIFVAPPFGSLGSTITWHLQRSSSLLSNEFGDTRFLGAMYSVTRKLKALKPYFRNQRKQKGDLSLNVRLAKEFLATVQELLRQDRHDALLLLLESCCRLVYLKAVKLEQLMLQQRAKLQWLKGGDHCTRFFFRRVATRRARMRVFQINEDKAPGPDGYSAAFFKAAWPVVGEEMTQAVLEFFQNGRLLKQVNATLLTLIPKDCLDDLISPTQNAFVPGGWIGDNVMLAQELFMGYNQRHLPKRCALKVDLRKAYDTVEWDFLLEVLRLFGFPSRFIGWIEECVTTPSYSVCINGEAHGFFRGARSTPGGSYVPLPLCSCNGTTPRDPTTDDFHRSFFSVPLEMC